MGPLSTTEMSRLDKVIHPLGGKNEFKVCRMWTEKNVEDCQCGGGGAAGAEGLSPEFLILILNSFIPFFLSGKTFFLLLFVYKWSFGQI